jgi:hypothetical protein
VIDGVYDIDEERKERKAAQVKARYAAMPEKDLERELRQIEKQMLDAARISSSSARPNCAIALYSCAKRCSAVALPTET